MTADLPRAIPLEGASNLRDIGGWPSAAGGRVRFGQVYRSAALHALTPADVTTLRGLGVADVVDLRGEGERARWPSAFPGVRTHEMTISPSIGASLRDLAQNPAAGPQDVVAVMCRAYGAYALDWHHRYRHMFDLLLAPDAPPLLFHCTAGKDRTGFGAALLLRALDVSPAHTMQDYLATNQHWRGDSELAATLPPYVGQVLLSVRPAFLEAAFAAIDAAHGSLDTYLTDRMGLDDARRSALRARLLA